MKRINVSGVREIKQTFGRFLAILLIIGLGVGFFAGLKITRKAMVATTQDYLDTLKFYDFRALSTLGFRQEEVEMIAEDPEVYAAEGGLAFDIMYSTHKGKSGEIKVLSIPQEVNLLNLVDGRMPEADNECVVDEKIFGDGFIGDVLTLIDENEEDDLDHFTYKEYTIVGLVRSPLYIQYERGNTSLGDGMLDAFAYIPKNGFAEDYYTEIYIKLKENYGIYSDEYNDYIEGLQDRFEDLVQVAADNRYDDIIREADDKLADAQLELDDAKAEGQSKLDEARQELDDAKVKLEEAEQQIADGESQIAEGKQDLADAKIKLADAEKELAEGYETYYDKLKEFQDGEAELEDGKKKLADARAEIEDARKELSKAQKELNAQKAALEPMLPYMTPAQVAMVNAQFDAYQAQIDSGYADIYVANGKLYEKDLEIQDAEAELEDGRQKLADALKELRGGEKKIVDAKQDMADGEKKIADAEADLAEGRAKYEEGLAEYADGEAKYADGQKEFDEKVGDAEVKLADARQEIDDLERPEIYLLGRNTNIGYVCFENDSNIVDGIADVFPIFFFLVAALVCITTMNRMVEEQRTQIGVLKALGYSNGAILWKYLMYSGSAAVLGCVGGYFGGIYAFPTVIWVSYGLMYSMQDLVHVSSPVLFAISMVAALLCSAGTTIISIEAELRVVPAQLMRPKAPKAGRRVFLEYVPFIWKRLSFLRKVAVRNIFRYKKRLFMMVLGISGCTALLITGMGIKDSISGMADQQYTTIELYDISASFVDPIEEIPEVMAEINMDPAKYMRVLENTRDLCTDLGNKNVKLLVIDDNDTENLDAFLNLHTRDDEKIPYPGFGEALITDRIAADYNIHVGDTITLQDTDLNVMKVTISGIYRNYIYNYVLMGSDTYVAAGGAEVEYSNLWISLGEDDPYEVSSKLLGSSEVASVSVSADIRTYVGNMLEALNLIVYVVIANAAGLAFIVLYNLTNINITERVREIAIIKVMGFYKKETGDYVFRENLILTFMGDVLGLFLGKLLHSFVMSQIVVDMVSFDSLVKPTSYIYSFLLTLVFALVINKCMGGKIAAVDMAESLKSVD